MKFINFTALDKPVHNAKHNLYFNTNITNNLRQFLHVHNIANFPVSNKQLTKQMMLFIEELFSNSIV